MSTATLNSNLIADARAGLAQSPPTLPCKWFYDERGSQLFDAICELPEYYPTRTELRLTQQIVGEIGAALGRDISLLEFGSGSSLKTRVLLENLSVETYVPLDISREHLLASAAQLEREFPNLKIAPVVADYTAPFELPALGDGPRVIYFPGSTIGNFAPDPAVDFLRNARRCGDRLLIGVDLPKEAEALVAAYNDAQGVTARFNLNLLERLNREAGADFDLGLWRHQAIWDAERSRIEMRLVSLADQCSHVAGRGFAFGRGEYIVTEHSYKYSRAAFDQLAARAGWQIERVWTDEKSWFSLQLARAK